MRLLNTITYELCDNTGPESSDTIVRYAILSHRWRDGEITFANHDSAMLREAGPTTPSLKKILGACDRARTQRFDWIWIDSLCINKSDLSELSEAINSMYRWYQRAAICYTYLDDACAHGMSRCEIFKSHLPDRAKLQLPSEWFERGWSLQELLAPRTMEFFDKDWTLMGTRDELSGVLEMLTSIRAEYLTGKRDFRDASVATRMSWQARRSTTRPEDLAYSMLGIFDVFLTPIYGEGANAFRRLQEQIIEQSDDESIFAWIADTLPCPIDPRKWKSGEWGLLAPSPACFEDSGEITNKGPFKTRANGGYRMTQQGIQFPMPVLNGERRERLQMTRMAKWQSKYIANSFRPLDKQGGLPLPLNCWWPSKDGTLHTVFIHLRLETVGPPTWKRIKTDQLGTWDQDVPDSDPADWVRSDIILQPRIEYWR